MVALKTFSEVSPKWAIGCSRSGSHSGPPTLLLDVGPLISKSTAVSPQMVIDFSLHVKKASACEHRVGQAFCCRVGWCALLPRSSVEGAAPALQQRRAQAKGWGKPEPARPRRRLLQKWRMRGPASEFVASRSLQLYQTMFPEVCFRAHTYVFAAVLVAGQVQARRIFDVLRTV